MQIAEEQESEEADLDKEAAEALSTLKSTEEPAQETAAEAPPVEKKVRFYLFHCE